MSLFDHLSAQFGARYREGSLVVMKNHLIRLLRLLGVPDDASPADQLAAIRDLPRVSHSLADLAPSSSKAIANTLLQVLIDRAPKEKALLESAKQLLREYDTQFKSKAQLRPPTIEETKVLKSGYDSLFEKVDFSLRPSADASSSDIRVLRQAQELAIAALYYFLPPLRPESYATMQVGKPAEDDKTTNFYVPSSGEIHMRSYKTSDTHGAYVLALPPALKDILNSYVSLLSESTLDSGRNLFPNLRSGKPLTSRGILEILRRVTGQSVGTSQLRALYITERAPHLDAEARRLMAIAMGHSLTTQVMTYERHAAEEE